MKLTLDDLVNEMAWFFRLKRAELWGRMKPACFGVLKQKEFSVFKYSLGLNPVPAGVAKQRVVVTVNGEPGETIMLEPSATEVEFKAGPVGAEVVVTLDYLDEAGNDGGNADFRFTVIDQVAPPTPAGFGDLKQTEEVA